MIVLVIATAGAVGFLAFRQYDRTLRPVEIEHADLRFDLLTERLANSVANVVPNIKGFRSSTALNELVRAATERDATPGTKAAYAEWRDQLARRLLLEMQAQPNYSQFRLIGAADGGREIVRVDRQGAGGALRIVPDASLQRKGDRPYFRDTIQLPPGAIYASPIDLNQENGKVEVPHVPTLRIATSISGPQGKPFGVLVINIDLGRAFAQFREAIKRPARGYVVNASGDYLVSPDRSHEFGFELGKRARIQDAVPRFTALAKQPDPPPTITTAPSGEEELLLIEPAILASHQLVYMAETVPMAALGASERPVIVAGAEAAAVAVACAIALALFLSRSLTRPLREMAVSVEAFSHGDPFDRPARARGEVAVLANAFDRMAAEVTERTDAMRNNAEIFESIMSHLGDPVVLLDSDGRWIYANSAARTLFGDRFGIAAAAWRSMMRSFAADGVTPVSDEARPITRVLRGEDVDNDDLTLVLPDGTRAEFVVSGRPIRGPEGEVSRAVMVYRDISALRDTERQLRQSQKMEAVGQLTGGIAHDFNNILTVVIGAAELLSDRVGDQPELRAFADTIAKAGQRGAGLTMQLLAFARRQALDPRRTDVNGHVADAVKLLRTTIGEHIEIMLELRDVWPVMIDPSQLSTALLNLAVNARDAMAEGGKLTIETQNAILDDAYARENDEVIPGQYVMIAVSDTGTGIPAAVLERVFEPFYTTKDVGKGTGLGLSMVYGFVKQSGGHVKVYSEVGQGTTVKLYLPRATDTDLAEAAPAAVEPMPRGTETILVVEDDAHVRANAVVQLESLGYTVIAASGGPEALALTESGVAYDLLFTDVVMPGGMNGRQLADALVKERPGVAVLFASGYTENAIHHQGRLDPGVALLNKPYRRTELAQKVRAVLDASRG